MADRPAPGLCTRLAKLAGTAAVLAACNGAPVDPPSAADTVRAFEAASATWEPATLQDMPPDAELRHDGQLYRVGDTDLMWLGAPSEDALAQADAAFTDVDCHAAPLEDDWGLVFADDALEPSAAAHHARLWEVDDGAQVAFDGRLFLVVDAQPEPSGDVLGRVVDTFARQAPEVIDAVVQYADGGQDPLTGTPNHPFWVPAVGDYVPLGDLEVGTALHTRAGGEALLVSKTWRQGDFTVFDVEVQGLHSFYVRGPGGDAAGVLVHNSTGPKLLTDSGPKVRGKANPIGEQGPFNVTPGGDAVPPVDKFNPGELVQHPRQGNYGKTNYGTVDPETGKFKEMVAVHPKEPGKGPNTHGGQDHYHLNRDKEPIYAPE